MNMKIWTQQQKYLSVAAVSILLILVVKFDNQLENLWWKATTPFRVWKFQSELSKRGHCSSTVEPAKVLRNFNTSRAYPREAQRNEIEGNISLLLSLDEYGVVKYIQIQSAEPKGYFEEDAKRGANKMVYLPAVKYCRTVPSTVTFKVQYSLESR